MTTHLSLVKPRVSECEVAERFHPEKGWANRAKETSAVLSSHLLNQPSSVKSTIVGLALDYLKPTVEEILDAHAFFPLTARISRTIPNSMIAVKLIDFIAKNHLASFLFHTLKLLGYGVDGLEKSDLFITSCVNTVFAFSPIFFGKQRGKQIFPHIKAGRCRDFQVTFSHEQKNVLTINDLFDGILLRRINQSAWIQEQEGESQECQINIQEQVCALDFLNFIDKAYYDIAKTTFSAAEKLEQMKQAIVKESHSFNAKVLESFKKALQTNQREVTPDQSFLYIVSITNQDQKEDKSFGLVFDHIFMVEQFFSEAAQEGCFRLLQSWVAQGTIADEMRRHGWAEGKSMSMADMEQFLTAFTKCFSPDRPGEGVFFNDCFGYAVERSPLYAFKGDDLIGPTITFWVEPVNPNHYLGHATAMIEEIPELKNIFKVQ